MQSTKAGKSGQQENEAVSHMAWVVRKQRGMDASQPAFSFFFYPVLGASVWMMFSTFKVKLPFSVDILWLYTQTSPEI